LKAISPLAKPYAAGIEFSALALVDSGFRAVRHDRLRHLMPGYKLVPPYLDED